MEYDLKDNLLMFIPEDDADVFNLGEIAPHFSHKTFWQTKNDIPKLKSITINIADIFVMLNMLLKKSEHHFIERS